MWNALNASQLRWSLPRQSSSVDHVQFTARSGVTSERSIAVVLRAETSGILVILPSFSRNNLVHNTIYKPVASQCSTSLFPKAVHER